MRKPWILKINEQTLNMYVCTSQRHNKILKSEFLMTKYKNKFPKTVKPRR